MNHKQEDSGVIVIQVQSTNHDQTTQFDDSQSFGRVGNLTAFQARFRKLSQDGVLHIIVVLQAHFY